MKTICSYILGLSLFLLVPACKVQQAVQNDGFRISKILNNTNQRISSNVEFEIKDKSSGQLLYSTLIGINRKVFFYFKEPKTSLLLANGKYRFSAKYVGYSETIANNIVIDTRYDYKVTLLLQQNNEQLH